MSFRLTAIALVLTLMAAGAGCAGASDIVLATTTSTVDSGLLSRLIPVFQQKSGYNVRPIAVGSGQAMALGERGEADVLLVHAPVLERQFMEAGYGILRRRVMYNDFVIVGPPSDPAGIKGMTDAAAAFRRIAESRAIFISRGDNSGTHQTETGLWQQAGIEPAGRSWYQTTGQGMGQTLAITADKQGYTITDRATYLVTSRSTGLAVLVEGNSSLINVYHVIVVNPERSPYVNVTGAKAFADFLLERDTQALIARFGIDRYGSPLFSAIAAKEENAP